MEIPSAEKIFKMNYGFAKTLDFRIRGNDIYGGTVLNRSLHWLFIAGSCGADYSFLCQ